MFVCPECGSRADQVGACDSDGAARVHTDDAFLGMTFRSVPASGLVDLDRAGANDITYAFRSPWRLPGAAEPAMCAVMVSVSKLSVSAVTTTSGCETAIVSPPRCSAAVVWNAARATGAAGDRLAALEWAASTLRLPGGRTVIGPRWSFSTASAEHSIVGAAMATIEDCEGAPGTAAPPTAR